MIFLKKVFFKYSSPFLKKQSNKGAITVEYALTMVVAAIFMIGVELMFRRLAIDLIRQFKQIVMIFPDIFMRNLVGLWLILRLREEAGGYDCGRTRPWKKGP